MCHSWAAAGSKVRLGGTRGKDNTNKQVVHFRNIIGHFSHVYSPTVGTTWLLPPRSTRYQTFLGHENGPSLPFVWRCSFSFLIHVILRSGAYGSGLSSHDIDLSFSDQPTFSHDLWPQGSVPQSSGPSPPLHLPPISAPQTDYFGFMIFLRLWCRWGWVLQMHCSWLCSPEASRSSVYYLAWFYGFCMGKILIYFINLTVGKNLLENCNNMVQEK